MNIERKQEKNKNGEVEKRKTHRDKIETNRNMKTYQKNYKVDERF